MARALDAVDRGILHALEEDARNTTAREMAARVDVSPSTVRNRIERLEDRGVILGYLPEIDYHAAGIPLRVLLVCTPHGDDRADAIGDLFDARGVVDVAWAVTDRECVYAELVAANRAEIEAGVAAIHERGLAVDRSEIVRTHRRRPANYHFVTGDNAPEPGDGP